MTGTITKILSKTQLVDAKYTKFILSEQALTCQVNPTGGCDVFTLFLKIEVYFPAVW